MIRKKRFLAGLFVILLGISALCGCGNMNDGNVKVVLTTGFDNDEVFRIEEMSCKLSEIMVYLTNIQNQYEGVYGSEIWNTNPGGITLEENVKDIALAKIAQIKTMNLMAKQYQLELDDKEEALVKEAAADYYASLNETEIEQMGVTEDTISTLYKEYALAQKVYQFIIKDINPEISDDEARTITVQQILIRTYALDGTGKKIEYTSEAREDAYETACEVLSELENGADFDEMIRHYNEDDKSTYSFGKGEMDPAFEEAAFNLGTDEISDIVESEYGYHIIKCINTFDREETDSNKVMIVEQRRKEVFGQEYDQFVKSLTRKLNDELWNGLHFIHNDEVKTTSFFDVYKKYFGE